MMLLLFFTLKEPSAAPRNIRIRPITTTSANISWDPPPVQNRCGFISRYDITVSYYEKSQEYWSRSFYTLKEDNTSVEVGGKTKTQAIAGYKLHVLHILVVCNSFIQV